MTAAALTLDATAFHRVVFGSSSATMREVESDLLEISHLMARALRG